MLMGLPPCVCLVDSGLRGDSKGWPAYLAQNFGLLLHIGLVEEADHVDCEVGR